MGSWNLILCAGLRSGSFKSLFDASFSWRWPSWIPKHCFLILNLHWGCNIRCENGSVSCRCHPKTSWAGDRSVGNLGMFRNISIAAANPDLSSILVWLLNVALMIFCLTAGSVSLIWCDWWTTSCRSLQTGPWTVKLSCCSLWRVHCILRCMKWWTQWLVLLSRVCRTCKHVGNLKIDQWGWGIVDPHTLPGPCEVTGMGKGLPREHVLVPLLDLVIFLGMDGKFLQCFWCLGLWMATKSTFWWGLPSCLPAGDLLAICAGMSGEVCLAGANRRLSLTMNPSSSMLSLYRWLQNGSRFWAKSIFCSGQPILIIANFSIPYSWSWCCGVPEDNCLIAALRFDFSNRLTVAIMAADTVVSSSMMYSFPALRCRILERTSASVLSDPLIKTAWNCRWSSLALSLWTRLFSI